MKRILIEKSFIRNALITIYILAVLGFSATARAQMTINPIFSDYKPVPTQTYVGEVAMTPNQDFYLVVSETEVYRLATNVDMQQFHGQLVEIEAYELEHKTGPVSNLSMDPLPGNESPTAAVPVLVVFGISEVVN
jgi:hypothetical protein